MPIGSFHRHLSSVQAVQRKILLVEDDRSIADTVVYALKTEGFVATWTQSGGEANGLMTDESFDAVILDVGLPDSDGFELCRQIRLHSDIPIVFPTARSDEFDRIEARPKADGPTPDGTPAEEGV